MKGWHFLTSPLLGASHEPLRPPQTDQFSDGRHPSKKKDPFPNLGATRARACTAHVGKFLSRGAQMFAKNLLPSFFFGFPVFGGVTPRGAGVERFASRLGDSMKLSVGDAQRVQV